VASEVHRLGKLGAIPLFIVTRGINLGAYRTALQRSFLTLSTNARQVVATHSGHFIQVDQPATVIAAIRSVVVSVRTGKPLS
jgi:hypothetical protein